MAAMCSGTALLMLLLLAAPWLLAEYWLAQLTFILIYAIAGPGPDAAGRLHRAVLIWAMRPFWGWAPTPRRADQHGLPFPLALAWPRLSAAVGVVVGLPALRVKGIYLGMATLSFGFIVEEVLARWESVTGGNAGMHVKAPNLFGWKLDSGRGSSTSCAWSSPWLPRWPS
jgi:branched-chain amino acid transport system permease protein